ncbi:hypothetical protein [Pseudonocardia xishanensis]|uniref:Uncharacterized protein n=1 Tax=Pseudonocardia xishanensis TaxID=630995 RepID=A0ABP8S0W2_9PSEU
MSTRRFPQTRNLRRTGLIDGLATAGLAATGMATAAVLLTTTLTGEATIRTVAAPELKIALSVVGTQNGGLDCRQVGVSADYETLAGVHQLVCGRSPESGRQLP